MTELLDKKQLDQALSDMAEQIVSLYGIENIALIGIRTRGVPIAERLVEKIKKKSNIDVAMGVLDITLYRDDLTTIAEQPVIKHTEISFSIENKVIILVDDVLYTGRTIRSALDAIFDFGRPLAVHLAVLVERLGRELPIQADIIGLHYDSDENDNVKVRLSEIDGEDKVEVILKEK